MTSRSRLPRTLFGILIALALAAPVAACAKNQQNSANGSPGSGQIGDAPAGGQGPAGDTPATATPTPTPAPTVAPTTAPPGGSGGGVIVVDPGLLLPWPSPADCVSHNPATSTVVYNSSAAVWQVVDGGHAMMAFKRDVDAQDGLKLAKAYKTECWIGRSNTRTNRYQYIMSYWTDPVLPAPAIASPDCLSHNPSNLTVVDLGSLGWRIDDGSEAIQLFDTKADADKGVLVMKHYNRHCYVGRGYGGSDRLQYIIEWFAKV
jgi:hypothetical protein